MGKLGSLIPIICLYRQSFSPINRGFSISLLGLILARLLGPPAGRQLIHGHILVSIPVRGGETSSSTRPIHIVRFRQGISKLYMVILEVWYVWRESARKLSRRGESDGNNIKSEIYGLSADRSSQEEPLDIVDPRLPIQSRRRFVPTTLFVLCGVMISPKLACAPDAMR